ncbi:MAG: MG2 domain-containing protein, partial [Pseudomonadota bacterium]
MRFPLISFVLIALALAGRADDLVPERRMVAERNTDFYGGDLRSIFDTSADLCVASCLADGLCRAMTYNQRASACFLKSDVTDRVPYEGALSMRVVEAPPSVLAIAETRAAAVALPPARIASARARAEGIGRVFPDTGIAAAALRADAVARAGDAPAVARDLALAAAALEDRAGDWLFAADLAARDLRAEDRAQRRRARALAADAALNAYLRAESDALAATALLTLSAALEADGEGRATIALLRESFRLDPRAPTQAALERAVGLYGFRVLETRVESDLALPRVCLLFSEPLRSVGFDYTPYLRLPEGDFAVETDARELCIAGVAHGATVDVTLRQGLPSLSGEVLAATVTQQVYIRDRAPSVRFPGRGYVLPRRPDATLPIVTVNTEEVALALHRVLDRNLVSALRDDLLDRPLRAWEAAALSRDLGETVWTGQAETAVELNRDVTTALPIGEAIGTAAPGVYALTAEVPGAPVATQWFLVSDLGLAGLSGPDGVHGFVRGLDNARPRAGVTVELLARNNARLGTAETDEMGHVLFPASVIREAEPALLVARTEDDYVYLDLTEAGFDLSDRGVAGRAPPGPIDVFLATERGAYRPGERVHATVLMRDARAAAIEGIPLTAIVTRPDGVAFNRRVLRDAGAGGRVLAVDLPPTAQRGRWRIGIHADPEAPPIATATVLVEDFVPERIDHVIDWSDGPLRPGDVARIGIAARYLYGAPGADLQIEGEVLLRATGRLDAHPGYRFGPASADQTPNVTPLDAPGTTDAEGRATITVTLGEAPDPLAPATVEAVLRLSDASRRPVERRLQRPLTPTAPLIGVRPLFDSAAPEGGTAAFDVIAVGRDGARRALPAVDWTLERVRTDYQWYEIDGRWQFEPITRRERVGVGALDLVADEIGRIEAPVAWGRYELTLSSEADGFAVTSLPFSAGWYAAGAGSETPDRLSVALDRARYAPGETATLRIDAETEGEVLVTVIAGDVLDMMAISVPAGESEVMLDVTEAWRPGAYVTATLVRPADAGAKRGPERALGLAWAGLEPGPARLGATLAVPDVVSPRSPLPIALTPTGLTDGETVFATIAAVDVGILNLTGHEAPNPEAHYLGQRR